MGLNKSALVLLFCFLAGSRAQVIVETGSGQLRGTTEVSRNGSTYYAFKGIPYAEKPIRFETSKPVEPWTGIRDAGSYGTMCPQYTSMFDLDPGHFVGDEDCLFLNVFFPTEDRCGAEKLPVLFFIHGGGFVAGSGGIYDPTFFLDECIVYVSINYRLGVAGFLTMSDEILPGNLGLKDALLALKWINANVENFRGDSGAITLSGESAGSVSVSNFVASPAAAGLFHRAIMMSGSSLSPLGLMQKPIEVALKAARALSCQGTSSLEVRDCLRAKPIQDLVSLETALQPWIALLPELGPVVEHANASQPFIPEHPYERLKRGDFNRVPIMLGIDRDEGFMIFGGPTVMSPEALDDLNNDWLSTAPLAFRYAHLNVSQEQTDDISSRIRSHYFGDKLVGPETERNLVDLETDRYFGSVMNEESLLLSQHAPVYQYVMTHEGDFSMYSFLYGREDFIVTHFHEMIYLSRLYDYIPEFVPGTEMHSVSVNLVKLWTSFIKTGVPTAVWGNEEESWVPFTARNPAILQLDATTANLVDFREDRMSFWRNLGLRELEFPQVPKH